MGDHGDCKDVLKDGMRRPGSAQMIRYDDS